MQGSMSSINSTWLELTLSHMQAHEAQTALSAAKQEAATARVTAEQHADGGEQPRVNMQVRTLLGCSNKH